MLLKPQLAAECEHGLIFAQNIPDNPANAAGLCIGNDVLHQDAPQSLTGKLVAHDDGIFGHLAIGIGMQMHGAVEFGLTGDFISVGDDQRHFAVIVNLGKARSGHVAKLFHGGKKAQPNLLGR